MTETEKYARTTISVPPDLKAQMDAVEVSVNWSAIACHAFEAKLADIATKKEQRDMKDIVTRLRVSKRQADDTQYKAGVEAGREWAGDTAEADELEHLEHWYERLGRDADQFFNDSGYGQAYSNAEFLVFAIHPDDDGDRDAAEDFWGQAIGDDTAAVEKSAFLRGFVEGALQLWGEVKDQL